MKSWYLSNDNVIEKTETNGVGLLICKVQNAESSSLICAAPDLYDACKDLIEAVEDIPVCNLPGNLGMALTFAIEAVRKANGK